MTRFVVALVWAVALGSGVAQPILGPAVLMAAPEPFHYGRGGYAFEEELPPDWTVSKWLEEGGVDPDSVRALAFRLCALEAVPADLTLLSNLEALEIACGDGERELNVKSLEVLGKLPKLRSLELKSVSLTGRPQSIWKLTTLNELTIEGYALKVIPREIGAFKGLTALNLSFGGLVSLPPELATLKTLKRLNLSHNEALTALPAGMEDLPDLTFLNISGTGITHLPEGPRAFSALRSLDVSLTSITHLPAWVTQRVWDELDCRYCALQAPPTCYHLSHIASVNFGNVSFGSRLSLILTHAARTLDRGDNTDACLEFCGTSFPSLVLAVLVPVTPRSKVLYVFVRKTDPLNHWLLRQDTVHQLNQHGLLVYPRTIHPFDYPWQQYVIERDSRPLPNPASALDMLVMWMDGHRTVMGRLPVRRAGVIDEAPPGPLSLQKLALRRLVQEGKATVWPREARPDPAEGLFFPFNALSGVLVPSADIAALKAVMRERAVEPAVEQEEAEESAAMPPPRTRIRLDDAVQADEGAPAAEPMRES